MTNSRYSSVEDLNHYTIQVAKHLNKTPLNILRKAIANAEGCKGYQAHCHKLKQIQSSSYDGMLSRTGLGEFLNKDGVISPDDIFVLTGDIFLDGVENRERYLRKRLLKDQLPFQSIDDQGEFNPLTSLENDYVNSASNYLYIFQNYCHADGSKAVILNGKKWLSVEFHVPYTLGIDALNAIEGMKRVDGVAHDFGLDKNEAVLLHDLIKELMLPVAKLVKGHFCWKYTPDFEDQGEPTEQEGEAIGRGAFKSYLLIPFEYAYESTNNPDEWRDKLIGLTTKELLASPYSIRRKVDNNNFFTDSQSLEDVIKSHISGVAFSPDYFVHRTGIRDGKRFNQDLAETVMASQLGDLYMGIGSLNKVESKVLDYFLTQWRLPTNSILSRRKEKLAAADKVMSLYGYSRTGLMGLLNEISSLGVVEIDKGLKWLKEEDRVLWYALVSKSRSVTFVESAGCFAHFLAEVQLKEPLRKPQIEHAVKALKIALSI